MPVFTLQQLAECTHGKLYGSGEKQIEHLETDSRNINAGKTSLFIAIEGPRHDGHNFLDEIIQKGVECFMVEKETAALKKPGVSYILVNNSIRALQNIAAFYRSQLRMPLVAITGSNGKTVVKEWLAQSLALKHHVSRSPKSYNSQLGVPLSVWLLQESADWAVIEAGISLPGEMEKLEKTLRPEYGIFTNIGTAHQENFANTEQKIREKLLLFKHSKTVYYCRDHSLIHNTILAENHSFNTVSWSVKTDDCFLRVDHISKAKGNTQVSLWFRNQSLKVSIPFTDDASLENCLHILCFMLHQDFSAEEVQEGLNTLTPVAMRLEQIEGIRNCTLINDSYNSDLQSLRIALDYLSTQKQHKRHSLILSDIRQSGLSPSDLYKEVFRMVGAFRLDPLITVGGEINQSGDLPASALGFQTTEALLKKLPELDLRDQTILIKGAREFGFEKIVRALSKKKHTTMLEINLENLVYNLNYFRSLISPGTRIMVMVKALSYGSGSYEIANLLQHEKVDYLGVAFTDEGIELRKAGISLPIMVMAPTEESYEDLIDYSLEPEIFSLEGLRSFSAKVSSKQLQNYPIHIKIDTGMHRLGFMPDDLDTLIRELKKRQSIWVKAVFSHLAVADNSKEDEFTRKQIRLFQEKYNLLSESLDYHPIRHIVNSAGIERFPEAHYEMVRLGIGLHGISGQTQGLKTVSTLKTRICQIKQIPANETVGYNRHGTLDRDSTIAILPIGYADGLDRKLGNRKGQVLIQGRKVPFIGDICMDLSMIDITGMDARVDDEVIIFGEEHTIEELATQVDTIPYEILTNVSSRVKRIYLNP